MNKRKIFIIVCMCIISIFSGCSKTADYLLQNSDGSETISEETYNTSVSETEASSERDSEKSELTVTETDTENAAQIYVYICGAVNNPGVYEMDEGSRVFQLIEKAGGFAENAAQTCVNLANPLEDGEMIQVLTTQEMSEDGATVPSVSTGSSTVTSQAASDGKVNLNSATQEELMTLSGIGETKAQRIIEYRETNGEFQSTDEIMQVEGIGESTYDHIKEDITVR